MGLPKNEEGPFVLWYLIIFANRFIYKPIWLQAVLPNQVLISLEFCTESLFVWLVILIWSNSNSSLFYAWPPYLIFGAYHGLNAYAYAKMAVSCTYMNQIGSPLFLLSNLMCLYILCFQMYLIGALFICILYFSLFIIGGNFCSSSLF